MLFPYNTRSILVDRDLFKRQKYPQEKHMKKLHYCAFCSPFAEHIPT